MITYQRPRLVASKLRIPLADLLAHCERGELWCPRCKAWKVAELHFYRNRSSSTGYTSACRVCFGIQVKESSSGVKRYRLGRVSRPCDYCGNQLIKQAGQQIRLEGRTYQVHATCVDRAREFVYGEPMRDPVWEV